MCISENTPPTLPQRKYEKWNEKKGENVKKEERRKIT
jgi:hypothetical protein